MSENSIEMKGTTWDSKRGWVKPTKKIELLPYLYLEGYKMYWDIPKPKELTAEEYLELGDLWRKEPEIPFEGEEDFWLKWSGREKYLYGEKYNFSYKIQFLLNGIISILPFIPITGFILGLVI